ncbi:hypothetical protein MXD59_21655, partial [Frankia sp. Ag45/Mut15]
FPAVRLPHARIKSQCAIRVQLLSFFLVWAKHWVEVLDELAYESSGRVPVRVEPSRDHKSGDPSNTLCLERGRDGLEMTARGPGIVKEKYVRGWRRQSREVRGIERAGVVVIGIGWADSSGHSDACFASRSLSLFNVGFL